MEVTDSALNKNSKIVLTKDGISPTLVLNESKETIIPTVPKYTPPRPTYTRPKKSRSTHHD